MLESMKKLNPSYLNGELFRGDIRGLPKHYHCKGRKRYVKLLMGEGISRHWANEYASLDVIWYNSYSKAWTLRCLNKENDDFFYF